MVLFQTLSFRLSEARNKMIRTTIVASIKYLCYRFPLEVKWNQHLKLTDYIPLSWRQFYCKLHLVNIGFLKDIIWLFTEKLYKQCSNNVAESFLGVVHKCPLIVVIKKAYEYFLLFSFELLSLNTLSSKLNMTSLKFLKQVCVHRLYQQESSSFSWLICLY